MLLRAGEPLNAPLAALSQFRFRLTREGRFLKREKKEEAKRSAGVAGRAALLRTRAMAELVRALSSAHFLLFFCETFDDGMPYLSSSERGAE